MAIQWGATGFTSPMTHRVLDNDGPPTDVLAAGKPFDIDVSFEVPAALASLITAGDSFRLRAYVESIGPGQEIQIGELIVPGVTGQVLYDHRLIHVTTALLGEGELFGGVAVSGVYNLVVVFQHLAGGVSSVHSGYSDVESLLMIRSPV